MENYNNKETMADELKEMEAKQILSKCFIKEMETEDIVRAPILLSQVKEQIDPSVEENTILKCMEELGIIAKVFDSLGRPVKFPLNGRSFSQIYQRAGFGIKCPVLEGHTLEDAKKAQIINEGLSVSEGEALVLVREGEIQAVHSNEYVYISPTELLESSEEVLGRMGGTFKDGTNDVELTTFCFEIKDEKLRSNIENAFIMCGIDVTDHEVSVMVVTSDVALSSVYIYPVLRKGGKVKFLVGSPISMPHKGDASISRYKDNLQTVFTKFNEFTKELDKLRQKKVRNAFSLVNICNEVKIPAKVSSEIFEDFSLSFTDENGEFVATASDLYAALYECIMKYEVDGKNVSQLKVLELAENISRAVIHGLSDYDVPYVIKK